MIKIDHILCPTDLSPESDETLRYGAALARAYQAKLILLYCRKPGSVVEWATSTNAARVLQQSLFTYLDARSMAALDWEPVIAEAEDISQAIIDEATRRQADLIVMRSRRRPHAAALLGSTAEKVSRHAPCPALITHSPEQEWVDLSKGNINLKRVLIANDFSPDADFAVNYGVALAEEYQSELHMLHVLPQDPPEVVLMPIDSESQQMEALHKLDEAVPREAVLWCKLVTAVRLGKPAEEILDYAREHEINLICMGGRRPGFDLNEIFGSTTERVLRRAECPVLVGRSSAAQATSVRAA